MADKKQIVGSVVDNKVVLVDQKRALRDAKVLESAKEILEDKERLNAVKVVNPSIEIRLDGKGPAFRGSHALNVSEVRESMDNIHNVFKDVTNKDKTVKDITKL